MRRSISPLDCIQQLVTSYCKHQRVPRILEGRSNAIICTHLHCTIIRACPIEAKEEALDKGSIIAIYSLMHNIVNGFPLRQFTGKEWFWIGIVCGLPRPYGWRYRDHGPYQEGQLSYLALRVLVCKRGKGGNPAAYGTRGIQSEDGVCITITICCNPTSPPLQFR